MLEKEKMKSEDDDLVFIASYTCELLDKAAMLFQSLKEKPLDENDLTEWMKEYQSLVEYIKMVNSNAPVSIH